MLPSSQLKGEIFPILETFFKPLGWKYAKMPHRFEYRDDKWVFYLSWSFTQPSVHDFIIMHKEIDELKRNLNLSIPGIPNTFSIKGIDIITLRDSSCSYTYTPSAPLQKWGTLEYEELRKDRYSQPVNTLEELEKWVDGIYKYISSSGMDFIEEYKYLPNVLRLIDCEMDDPTHLWQSIMGFSFQKYTNVLLVAKLCGDINIDKKIDYIETILKNPEITIDEDGLTYWELFKKILKDVKPRYPHYSKLSEEDLRIFNPPLFKDKIRK